MSNVETENNQNLGMPLMLKLSQIVRFEDQPRKYFDEGALTVLADSIQSEGQKTPVKVCKHSSRKGIFVLIGGERRFRAFQIIEKRTGKEPLVKSYIDAVRDEKHHFMEALVDNLHREDLDPVDEAAALCKLHKEHNMSLADISKLIGKSLSYVDNYIRLDSLPDRVKKMMELSIPKSKRLQVTAAIEIAKSTLDPSLRTDLAYEAVNRDMGIGEVRQMIQARVEYVDTEGRRGRKRRASDDYSIFRRFIENTHKAAKLKLEFSNISRIYDTRDTEEVDRVRDAQMIRSIQSQLEKILKEVEETYKDRFKRTGKL